MPADPSSPNGPTAGTSGSDHPASPPEVLDGAGGKHNGVGWDDGHESIVFPTSDASVVSSAGHPWSPEATRLSNLFGGGQIAALTAG